MTPIGELQRKAQNCVGASIMLPEDLHSARKFFEGIVCCFESKGVKNLVHHGLKSGTRDEQSWQAGWLYALPFVLKQPTKEQTPKFLIAVNS